ncbi:MAG: D-(-)-3-hydroxybutyrate oligomer hydrolase [Glaciimonas sp.]|nr:D-(-)-3-hydroxybutyrate oligomer hydrolase [Glaciimonas sp.]
MVNQAMQRKVMTLAVATAVVSLAACGGDGGEDLNVKPVYLGAVSSLTYDGTTDDLLTAGLGKTGLGGASPTVANPLQPTAAELRKIAIWNNYRAVLDITANGGYGSLYGPNIDIAGNNTLGEGKIAGTEYIAYSDDGSGNQNVTMMVQLPASFNPVSPCIITGTSSGSRGVYGAIGSSGEWGLKHGCAVAYADKGTGNGIHDLQNNTVNLQNGVRADAAVAGKNSNFTANLTPAELAAFNAATPNRFAVKQAHSQQNPEKDWGKWTLQSIEFAYFVLNQTYGDLASDRVTHLIRFNPSNTIVIASSISNGAGAALAAAEQDTKGLISGVAVAEPHVQMAADNRLSVTRGSSTLTGTGKPLYDYFTLANLLQPCAALATTATSAFNAVNPAIAANRCTALQTNGLISGSNTAELAANAMAALIAAGFQPESRDLQASMYSFATPAIAMTYSNSYGRFSVKDNLCGLSFGATAAATSATPNAPAAATAAAVAASFGTGNGVPPTVGINLINNLSVGGPLLDAASLSLVNGVAVQNYNFDGALCQRELAVGSSANAKRVQQGISEAVRNGNLHGKPALIVHGRSDTLIPVAFSSRPYFGVNRMVEGNASKLSYIEIENGQHFDAFLGFPGFANRFIPVHRYFVQAMDMMYANLKTGAALPSSQVVRTVPRGLNGAVANPITLANVPAIKKVPDAADQITFANNVVNIPN